ncbi:MAG: hypothetical protein ACP5T4_00465 [Candidatus Micrarchaeia archaeon]
MGRIVKTILPFILALLLASAVNAQVLTQGFPTIQEPPLPPSTCNTIIGYMPKLGQQTTSSILSISGIIVLAVLVVLSIIYAIGKGAGLPGLVMYSQREYVETLFNIILIVIIAEGTGVIDGSIAFLSNMALSTTSTTASTVTISSAKDLYTNLCNSYLGKGLADAIVGALYILPTNFLQDVFQSITLYLAVDPNYIIIPEDMVIGAKIVPFTGIYPYNQLLGLEFNAFMGVALLSIGIAMLLILIYGLFPIFLYLGIAFRSFPWTRAAGGAFLSLFIAFYIIFPSLLLAFANVSFTPQSAGIAASNSAPPSPSATGAASYLSAIAGSLGTTFLPASAGKIITYEINSFVSIIMYDALQLIGIVIAVVVSVDLMEGLSDLLGAPSLQGKSLLKKVI